MADTVDLREIEELVDAPELFAAHVDRLAAMLLDAKRAVIFTGAGVSTASGIADYRGPDGVWTRKAQGRAPPKSVNMVAAAPTLAHRAIARLVATGRVRYLVSQNVDGLHLKSGVPRDSISELHGDVKLEVCWKCDASYLRDFNVVEHKNGNGRCGECKKRVKHFCHCTSRRCACGAVLKVRSADAALRCAACAAFGASCSAGVRPHRPAAASTRTGRTRCALTLSLPLAGLDHQLWRKPPRRADGARGRCLPLVRSRHLRRLVAARDARCGPSRECARAWRCTFPVCPPPRPLDLCVSEQTRPRGARSS